MRLNLMMSTLLCPREKLIAIPHDWWIVIINLLKRSEMLKLGCSKADLSSSVNERVYIFKQTCFVAINTTTAGTVQIYS